jgi:Spy/CpxP family protein refolding chaperone
VKNPWKLLVPFFLLGFLFGSAAGTWADKAATRRLWHMGADTDGALKKMTSKFGLTADQQTALRPILEARRVQIAALHDETMTKFLQIRTTTKTDVDKVLTPEQREKYDASVAQADSKFKKLLK